MNKTVVTQRELFEHTVEIAANTMARCPKGSWSKQAVKEALDETRSGLIMHLENNNYTIAES